MLTAAEVTAHLVARSLALTVRAPGTLAGATVHASTPLLPAAYDIAELRVTAYTQAQNCGNITTEASLQHQIRF